MFTATLIVVYILDAVDVAIEGNRNYSKYFSIILVSNDSYNDT